MSDNCSICGKTRPKCRALTCSVECWWKLSRLYDNAPAMLEALKRIRDAAGKATAEDVEVSPLGYVQNLGAIAEVMLDAVGE